MATFNQFAGQEVASGIRPNEPVIEFEGTASQTYLANMGLIRGLIPKVGKVLIRETRVFDNPLDKIFRKTSLPFGVGFEDFEFAEGAINKKTGDECIPHGSPAGNSQLNLLNLGWSFSVGIYDREINKAVLTPEEAGQYVAQKTRTMRKGFAMLKYRSMVQLISDVIDGTRSVSSTTQSDGQGSSVTYNPTITGYAGEVEDSGIVLPSLVQGTVPAFANAQAALDIVKRLENAATEMREEGTAYSKAGINTFLLQKPNLIMESKVLNAIDNAWAMDGTFKGIPTKTAREYMSQFADIVEIPGSFAALPTNATYADKRLAAVLIDKDSCTEAIQWEDVEEQRCTLSRMTGMNFAGAEALAVYRGNPAYALLTDES